MDSELRADRCEVCRFWENSQLGGIYGYCCRFPPMTVRHDDSIEDSCCIVPVGQWPATAKPQWCGEWQPKDTPPTPVLARPIATVAEVLAVANAPPSA